MDKTFFMDAFDGTQESITNNKNLILVMVSWVYLLHQVITEILHHYELSGLFFTNNWFSLVDKYGYPFLAIYEFQYLNLALNIFTWLEYFDGISVVLFKAFINISTDL